MGRLNTDDQFRFLISCIRYSNNGKIDFTEVAKECSIVSKGAAAKRYERMMKAHGIHQPIVSARDSTVTPLVKSKDPLKSISSKKRKNGFGESDETMADDDEEVPASRAGHRKIKREKDLSIATVKDEIVKEEIVKEEPRGLVESLPWLSMAPFHGNSLTNEATDEAASSVAAETREENFDDFFEFSNDPIFEMGTHHSLEIAETVKQEDTDDGDLAAQQSILID